MQFFLKQLISIFILAYIVGGCKPPYAPGNSIVSSLPKNSGKSWSLSFETVTDKADSREFKLAKVNLDSDKTQLKIYQFINPQKPVANVNQVAKSESLEAAVNASFFDIKRGQFLALGPTVVEGKEIDSYLDPQIEEEKYGVFYCMVGNECYISTLGSYKNLFGSKSKLPYLAVSGMSWSLKEGKVHPQSHGIKTNRTVIGLSHDRKILYLIQGWGSYLDIANAALAAGAYLAFNFDGGGSSQLVFRNQKFPMFNARATQDSQDFGDTTAVDFYANQRPVPVIFGVKELP